MNRAKMTVVAIGTGAAGLGAVVVLALATTSEAVRAGSTARPVVAAATRSAPRSIPFTVGQPAAMPASTHRSTPSAAGAVSKPSAPPSSIAAPRGASDVHGALRALRLALEADDVGSYESLVENLRASLHDATPAEIAAVLDLFRRSDDPALLGAIADALDPAGIERADVRNALLEIADRDPSLARRTTAITALGHAAPDDALVAKLSRIARDDSESEVRAAAVSALGTSVEQDPTRGALVNASLVDVATRDQDEQVRAAALWSVRAHDADSATVDRIAEVLVREDKLGPRQAAAEALAEVGPQHRDKAIAVLVDAIARDRDVDVRKTELASIVRAGRTQAIAHLEEIARKHPELAQDAQEWLAPLRKGEIDMDRIWDEKSRLETARREASGEAEHAHDAD